jgi:hypothetical protein
VFRSVLILLCTVVAATLLPSVGRATGGRYAFTGGTPRQQAGLHIEGGVLSRATPGKICLDADLLDAGTFAWRVVQHELAHQVDFFVVTASARASLVRELGVNVWCADGAPRRDQPGCERFASMLAWSYWQSPDNCMRPAASGGLNARRFRTVLSASIQLGGER